MVIWLIQVTATIPCVQARIPLITNLKGGCNADDDNHWQYRKHFSIPKQLAYIGPRETAGARRKKVA